MKTRPLSDSIKSAVLDTLTTFLQDFTDAITVGDRAKASVAAAQVSQLGLSVFEFFGAGAESITSTPEEKVACHEAAIVVRNLMEKNLEDWYRRSESSAAIAKLSIN